MGIGCTVKNISGRALDVWEQTVPGHSGALSEVKLTQKKSNVTSAPVGSWWFNSSCRFFFFISFNLAIFLQMISTGMIISPLSRSFCSPMGGFYLISSAR